MKLDSEVWPPNKSNSILLNERHFDVYSDEEPSKKTKKERKRGKRSKKADFNDLERTQAEKIFPDQVKEIDDLDYEYDLVGDDELKFKYRETIPEDYGTVPF